MQRKKTSAATSEEQHHPTAAAFSALVSLHLLVVVFSKSLFDISPPGRDQYQISSTPGDQAEMEFLVSIWRMEPWFKLDGESSGKKFQQMALFQKNLD